MKKLLLTIITLSIITLNGCYDPDTATVRINLGNMPVAHHEPKSFIDRILGLFEKDAYAVPADIVKVHIAAYSGDALLATASINSGDVQLDQKGNDYVELDVPAGKNITILVVGELYIGQGTPYAEYYGYSKVDLETGITSTVDVAVYNNTATHGNYPSWSTLLAFTYHSLSESLTWNNIGFKVKYHVYGNINPQTENYVLLYSGYDTSISNVGYYYGNRIYLEFEPFSLKTSYFTASTVQD
ncbi:MAG TPA: hypothetical protein PK514_07235 [Spirochaetota bacterium]|nr:hypothetical protein [Spirochaetota bacterium]